MFQFWLNAMRNFGRQKTVASGTHTEQNHPTSNNGRRRHSMGPRNPSRTTHQCKSCTPSMNGMTSTVQGKSRNRVSNKPSGVAKKKKKEITRRNSCHASTNHATKKSNQTVNKPTKVSRRSSCTASVGRIPTNGGGRPAVTVEQEAKRKVQKSPRRKSTTGTTKQHTHPSPKALKTNQKVKKVLRRHSYGSNTDYPGKTKCQPTPAASRRQSISGGCGSDRVKEGSIPSSPKRKSALSASVATNKPNHERNSPGRQQLSVSLNGGESSRPLLLPAQYNGNRSPSSSKKKQNGSKARSMSRHEKKTDQMENPRSEYMTKATGGPKSKKRQTRRQSCVATLPSESMSNSSVCSLSSSKHSILSALASPLKQTLSEAKYASVNSENKGRNKFWSPRKNGNKPTGGSGTESDDEECFWDLSLSNHGTVTASSHVSTSGSFYEESQVMAPDEIYDFKYVWTSTMIPEEQDDVTSPVDEKVSPMGLPMVPFYDFDYEGALSGLHLQKNQVSVRSKDHNYSRDTPPTSRPSSPSSNSGGIQATSLFHGSMSDLFVVNQGESTNNVDVIVPRFRFSPQRRVSMA